MSNKIILLMLPIFYCSAAAAQTHFKDVTATAGIQYRHHGFLYGGGIACGDFNHDGYLDIFIVDGKDYPNLFFINNGDGTFSERAAAAGFADNAEGFGAVAGDVDNDGDLDIYVTNYLAPNLLYLNRGDGTFEERSAAAGVNDPGPSTSAAMLDYDNDGWLDIFVLNRSQALLDYSTRLYRNLSGGTFEDVTEAAGAGFVGTSLGVACFDADLDGDQDILIADEFSKDAFLVNQGDGTFKNMADLAFDNAPGSAMGVDIADYDNDGDFDIYIGNFDADFLLRNRGDGTFNEVAASSGIRNTDIAWGVNFLDCNNDGVRDLYVVNGQMLYEDSFKRNENRFYYNRGDGTFVERAQSFGLQDAGDGRASVTADFNNDGYADLFVVNVNEGESVLYLNTPGENHWITLRLEGTVSNRSAVGARVELYASGQRQVDEVRAGSSYASSQPLDLEFGLGPAAVVDSILIRWPSGIQQKLAAVGSNQYFHIQEPASTTAISPRPGAGLQVARRFDLAQNYPNPFNPQTTIGLLLPATGEAQLTIFDSNGMLVQSQVLRAAGAGAYRFMWDGRDRRGTVVASGIYVYRVDFLPADRSRRFTLSRKMVLLR